MKDEEVKVGMKVLIPKTKGTGFYPISKFHIALDVVNVENKDYLYVIYQHPYADQNNRITYSLGINSTSGTSDKINGYGIGGFEFIAEDLTPFDLVERAKTLPLEDPKEFTPIFTAGQPVVSPIQMIPIAEDTILVDETLDSEDYFPQNPGYSATKDKDEMGKAELVDSSSFYMEAPLDKPKIDPKEKELYDKYIKGEITEQEYLIKGGFVVPEKPTDTVWTNKVGQTEEEVIKELHDILDKNPSIMDTNSKSPKEGLRFNEGKLDYTLMDLTSFSPMIEVLEFGAKKYSRDNWKKGGENFSLLKLLGSMLRHISKLLVGEMYDEESGLSHAGHVACNAMFICFYWNKYLKDKKNKQKTNFLDGIWKSGKK